MTIDKEAVKQLTRTVFITLMICGCFAILTPIFYVISKGWNDYQMWGAFGDYLGGTLNPVLAAANLIVLVVISYQLKAMDDERSDRESEIQRRTAMYGLQQQAIKDLTSIFEGVRLFAGITFEMHDSTGTIRGLIMQFQIFLQSNTHLFESLKTYSQDTMVNELRALIDDMAVLQDEYSLAEAYGNFETRGVKQARKTVVSRVATIVNIRTDLVKMLAEDFK
ncbi:hypothetical protein ACWKW6_12765 [Dyadobacter jiangsuensis]